MKLTHGSTIGQAKVTVDLLPKGTSSAWRTNTQTSITVHNTGNWNVPAENYNRAIKENNDGLADGEGREASWHLTVDDKEIYQHVDTSLETWNTGAGSKGNCTTIAIEICMFKDATRQKKAEDNAIALINYLQGKIKTIKTVRTHQSWSGKYCPYVILSRKNGWVDFSARIKAYGAVTKLYHTIKSGDTLWEISIKYKVTVDKLEVLNPGIKVKALKIGSKVRYK